MWKNFVLFGLTAITYANAFHLTEVKPQNTSVNEGEDLELFCASNGYYEWCTFVHNDKKCDFEWRRNVWNITTLDCSDYAGRAVFNADYENFQCGIKLSNVTLEDAGKWTCNLEQYHSGRYRGYGYNKTGEMNIEIIPKPTTTTTTTTTTTSTTTSKSTTTASTSLSSADVLFKPRSGGVPAQSPQEQTTNDPEQEEEEVEENSYMFIVIAVIILFIVALVATLFFLHYKRKLPPAFYNLGLRRQWKFVQGAEENEELQDEKKHPSIVKNGKTLEQNGVEDTSPMSESANVNPSLTTVTWSANEDQKKTNGTATNGTATNGITEEKEPLKENHEEEK